MKVLKRTVNWHSKYGVKPFKQLQMSSLRTLQSYSKLTRAKALRQATIKNAIFKSKNPKNLNFRVFKCLVLKNKNVSPELEIKFRKAITKGVSGVYDHDHMTPKMLYNLMILQHSLKGAIK